MQKKGNDRASMQFPTSASMPDDVVWKRDIYRQLDLTKDIETEKKAHEQTLHQEEHARTQEAERKAQEAERNALESERRAIKARMG